MSSLRSLIPLRLSHLIETSVHIFINSIVLFRCTLHPLLHVCLFNAKFDTVDDRPHCGTAGSISAYVHVSIYVYKLSYVLASHECLPVQIDLLTVETGGSSVGKAKTVSVWSKVIERVWLACSTSYMAVLI